MKKTSTKKQSRKEDFSSNDIAMRLLKKKFSKLRRSIFALAFLVSVSSFSIFNHAIMAGVMNGPIFVEAIPDLTPENVYDQLVKHGVQNPEIVLKQSILETGWYECEYCSLKHNNIFGFRYKKKYLEFDNWVDAVKYYKKWQDKRYKGGDYYHFLKSVGYATSKTYIQKLKSIKVDFL